MTPLSPSSSLSQHPPAPLPTLDRSPRIYRYPASSDSKRSSTRPLPSIISVLESKPMPSFVTSPSHSYSHPRYDPHTITSASSPSDILSSSGSTIASYTTTTSSTSLFFFPPFDSSTTTSGLKSSSKMSTDNKTHYTYTPAWDRPTASPHPNPPRKREKAIGFATNAFNPQGWSLPSTPLTSPTGSSETATTQKNIGAPAVLYTPIVKVPHPPRKRVEPIGLATNSFHPQGWHLPSADSSSSLTESESASIGSDEHILSPTDTDLEMSIGQLGDVKPRPMRRRTEPIGFAANGWDINLPVIPIQVDTRLQSPTSPSTNVFDWDPVYQCTKTKTKDVKPCTKWMTKTPTPPQVPETLPEELDQEDQGLLGYTYQLATATRLDVAESTSQSSSSSVGPAYSARSASWYKYKHSPPIEPQDDDIVLTEVDVRISLHPSITNTRRESSPHVPNDIRRQVNALHLDEIDLDKVEKPSPAKEALNEVWQKHMALAITPIAVEGVNVGEVKDKDQVYPSPKNTPPRPGRNKPRQNSAIMALRELCLDVPHNSPDLDRVFPTLSPSLQASGEHHDWTERQKPFDAETLSSKLRNSTGRVEFHQLQGLASPRVFQADLDDEEDAGSNVAIKGESTDVHPPRGRRKWSSGWN